MPTPTRSDAVALRPHPRPVALAPLPGREAAPSFLARVARAAVLRRLEGLRGGRLVVVAGGETHAFGPEGHPLHARVRVHHPAAFAQIAFGGTIGAAEAYADGLWDADDLTAALRIVFSQGDGGDGLEAGLARVGGLVHRLRHRARRNTPDGARENIAAHYDLGNDFFRLFLDPTMTYSCAVWERPGATLEEAQLDKIERICRKLDLKPGMRVLEIGTGWGALAIHAARTHGVHVTTATLSREQRDAAVERVRAAGLEDRVEVVLLDYRELAGRYDRVVSIEMIEAVGWEFYETFFRVVAERLHDDGLALVQAITIPDHRFERQKSEPNHINRLVFPGSCIPSTTALLQAAARASDLRLFHLEEIGPHYARTLREWRLRLLARWDEARAQGRSARFLRNFEYYLASCEAGYEERHLGDVQLLFARPRARRAPIVPPLAPAQERDAA